MSFVVRVAPWIVRYREPTADRVPDAERPERARDRVRLVDKIHASEVHRGPCGAPAGGGQGLSRSLDLGVASGFPRAG